MLVRVGLDPEAGIELGAGARAPRGAVIRMLGERCVLAADSASAAADTLRAFRDCGSPQLADAVASLVKARITISSGNAGSAPVPIADMLESDDVKTWFGIADLLLVSNDRADCLGESLDPEVATLRTALDTEAFDRVDQLWATLVLPGEKREAVWKKVFAPLASQPCEVYVIERHAPTDLFTSLNAMGASAPKMGAEWFLRALARSRVQRISMACSERYIRNSGLDPQEVLRTIDAWWRRIDTATPLVLKLVEGDFDHGRGLSFDGWAGFSPHNGLASFNRPEIAEPVSLHASLPLAHQIRRAFRAMRQVT